MAKGNAADETSTVSPQKKARGVFEYLMIADNTGHIPVQIQKHTMIGRIDAGDVYTFEYLYINPERKVVAMDSCRVC